MLEIALRNESSSAGPEHFRGHKKGLKGLYYLSPFVRDFQNCPQLKEHFKQLVGEDLIPHGMLSNAPQVNFSIYNKNAPLDSWHWDSVAYTGVIILNDMTNFVGGELEIMKMNKRLGLKVREVLTTFIHIGILNCIFKCIL